MSELISVIIPIYNKENYIDTCVKSVISQTYRNLEIILVDDGSKDGSVRKCDEYVEIDSRIVTIHKTNGGLSDARNAGIDIAHGEYYYFLDADDYIAPNTIEKLYKRIVETQSDIAICDLQWLDSQGKNIECKEMLIDEVIDRDELFRRLSELNNMLYVVAWNKLYKKELFSVYRYAYGKIHEDEFIIHYIYGQCKKAVTLSDKLYYYIQSGESITSQNTNMKRLDAIEAMYDRIQYYKKNGYQAYTPKIEEYIWWLLTECYVKIENNQETQKRLSEIKHLYNQLYVGMVKHNIKCLRKVITLTLFRINPNLYDSLVSRR